ncbi:hypothetical protein D3C86_2055680 [compost metagenome]
MQPFDHVTQQQRVEGNAQLLHFLAPDPLVLVAGQVVEMQLVANAAQEGLLCQFQRVEVGGKHQDQVKR